MSLYKKAGENILLADSLRVADSFFARLKGLMFSEPLKENEGLLITPCNSVHMMFMKYPIDAVFIDDSGRVEASYPGLKPWTGMTRLHSKAKSCIELKSGVLERFGVRVGDVLLLEKNS